MRLLAKACLLIGLVFLHQAGFAQSPGQLVLGSDLNQQASAIIPTIDGGYAMAGTYATLSSSDAEFLLVKFDTNGDTVFTRTYGSTIDSLAGGSSRHVTGNWANAVVQTSDGGYAIAGEAHDLGPGAGDMFVVRTDANGDTLWYNGYGGVADEYTFSIVENPDGTFIMSGFTESFGGTPRSGYLMLLDNAGDTIWTRTVGGAWIDGFQDCIPTLDGGFIAAGFTFSFGAGSADGYLCKLDVNGNIEWQRTYGGVSNEYFYSILQLPDSSYVMAGITESFGSGNEDVYLVKTDKNGDLDWSKAFGGTDYDGAYDLAPVGNDGYLLCGYSRSFGAGIHDIYVIRCDVSGDTLWTKTYGGAENEIGRAVTVWNSNRYLIAGQTNTFGAGGDDAYIITTDSMGVSGCHEYATATITTVAGTVQGTATGTLGTGSFVMQIPPKTAHTYSTLLDACTVTGIDDLSYATGMWLYPNPTTAELQISIPDLEQVLVYDLNGKVVWSGTEDRIDVGYLRDGIYSISAISNGSVFNSRFVKN